MASTPTARTAQTTPQDLAQQLAKPAAAAKIPAWFKRVAPEVKLARSRGMPLPTDLFDKDMTDIGEDSDPEARYQSTKNEPVSTPYAGRKGEKFYRQMNAKRDLRKHQLRVQRRKARLAYRKVMNQLLRPRNRKRRAPPVEGCEVDPETGRRTRPSWFYSVEERVRWLRDRPDDDNLDEEVEDGDLTDLGEDTEEGEPWYHDLQSSDESEGDASDSELYHDCKWKVGQRKHELRVDRRITAVLVAEDEVLESRVKADLLRVQQGEPEHVADVAGKRFELRCSRLRTYEEYETMPTGPRAYIQFQHLPPGEKGLSGYLFIRDGVMWAFRTNESPLPGTSGKDGSPTVVVKIWGKKIHPGDEGENDEIKITFVANDSIMVKVPGCKVVERTEKEWARECGDNWYGKMTKAKSTPEFLTFRGVLVPTPDIWEQAKNAKCVSY
ncbi:hypothetical protein QBC34DRAFT_401480 [Podospora aff. communis PSN243]|uniref:Uncharacterized protein n=1 Tax=Podospora aff. communis PSN243 TaxID=3040156 RepID=A0AAV9GS23_9PEZI|nr:hypothetical protein QBC34DRAFT_401480 [Podospora aff. communis PSN243]